MSEGAPASEVRPTLHQRRSRETRQLILDAAYRVVSRKGYGEATVEEVVQEAGTSTGAFYYHFPSKEALFRALLREHVQRTVHASANLAPPTSLREAVERLVSFWLEHIRTDDGTRPLMLEFWAHATRQDWAHEEVSAALRQFRDSIVKTLRAGQDAAVVRPGLDTTAAAFAIVSALQGAALLYTIDSDQIDLDAARQPLVELIERYVTAAEVSERRSDSR